MRLHGLYAPITTVFGANGELDPAATAANCRTMVERGVDGIVVAGSTGEAPLLDERERDLLLSAVRAALPERQIVMGIGAESTRQTVARARAAAAKGADAVLCVAPHYFGAGAMSDAALRAHYTAVADASPVPVVLYSIPKYMHFALSASLVAALSAHPNIIGIKDSSGDPAILEGYLASQRDVFSVLTGNGGQWLNALRAGARAGILAVCAFAPALSRAVFDAFHAGREDEAAAAQARLTPLAMEIVGKMGIAGVKVAYDEVGLIGGPVRPPLLALDAAGRERVRGLIAASGVEALTTTAA